MTNEAVTIELGPNQGHPVRRTCDNATAIAKGTLLRLWDNNQCSGSTAAEIGSIPFAGIAVEEKTISDGLTQISAYTEGVFDLLSTDASLTTAGQICSLSGANSVKLCTEAELVLGAAVGKTEEAGADQEVIRVRLIGH